MADENNPKITRDVIATDGANMKTPYREVNGGAHPKTPAKPVEEGKKKTS